jgi:hypothetical protein
LRYCFGPLNRKTGRRIPVEQDCFHVALDEGGQSHDLPLPQPRRAQTLTLVSILVGHDCSIATNARADETGELLADLKHAL